MSEVENSSEENYDWLTEALFEPIIKNELSDYARNDYELKITSIKPAVGKGDNYISLVTRVELEVKFINTSKLDYASKTYNFIVKSSITLIKEIEEAGVFEKEISFYEDVVNSFRKLDDSITYLPKCYSIISHGRKIIIMNDLTMMGFKMGDRLAGLDLEHCKIYFKSIAQFHAISAVHYENVGRYPDRFHLPLNRIEHKEMYEKWSDILYTELLKIFDLYDGLKPYREKFHKWKACIFEAVCEITKEKSDEFNVLNHGDSWLNNMLFQHDADNKPNGICFVDFQVSVYGTPMYDILYFFATSPTVEVREHHFDELLQVYHTSLTEYLTRYNYSKPIPTMRDLQMMVLKHGLLMSYFLTGVTSIVLLDSENTRPLNFFMLEGEEGDTFRYNLYNNPRYIKVLEVTLRFMDRRGLLEF